jgi:hypothetical protein
VATYLSISVTTKEARAGKFLGVRNGRLPTQSVRRSGTSFIILLEPDITGDQPYTQGALATR